MIRTFIDIPKVQRPTRASLMNLVTSTKNLIEPMATYDVNTDSWGVWIVPILARKLDAASYSEWCMERPRRAKPEVAPLLQFIINRAEGVEELPQAQNNYFRGGSQQHHNNNFRGGQNNQNYNNNRHNSQQQNRSTTGTNANSNNSAPSTAGGGRANKIQKRNRCPDPLCEPSNDHQMFNCPRFRSLDLEHRRQKVRVPGIYELCLRKGHQKSSCSMKSCQECFARNVSK